MKVITGIYLHCRPELRDDWLAGSDIDAEVEDALPQEQAIRALTHFYNVQRYPQSMGADEEMLDEERDFFVRELEKMHVLGIGGIGGNGVGDLLGGEGGSNSGNGNGGGGAGGGPANGVGFNGNVTQANGNAGTIVNGNGAGHHGGNMGDRDVASEVGSWELLGEHWGEMPPI